MTRSQPCGCLYVKTPISYLIVRNHLCSHFMTVFRLYQQNRKKKIFLPNYQFLLGASDREESLGKDNTDRESFLLHLKQQDKAYPPKSVSLTISIFVYSDISHKVVGRPWASFTLIIKSPNVDPGYPQPCDLCLVFWFYSLRQVSPSGMWSYNRLFHSLERIKQAPKHVST